MKFKLDKPFSSMYIDPNSSLKERWIKALRDPAYLFASLLVIFLYLLFFFT